MRFQWLGTLGVVVLLSNQLNGVQYEESIAARLIRDGWERYQSGKIDDAIRILEDAVREAQVDRPIQLSQINECRAKLAWLQCVQGHKESAEFYLRLVQKSELKPADIGRLELVLAKYALSPKEVAEHLDRASRSLDGTDGRLRADSYMQLARIHFDLGQMEEAFAASQRARSLLDVKLNGLELFRVLVLEARIECARNRNSSAIKSVQQAGTIFNDVYSQISLDERVEYYRVASDCRSEGSDLVIAYELLEKARAELVAQRGDNDASLVPLVLKQAEILIREGRLTEATSFVDWCMRAGKSRADWISQSLVVRGMLNFTIGDYHRAQADIGNAIANLGTANPTDRKWLASQLDLQLVTSYQGPSESVTVRVRDLQNQTLNAKDRARCCLILAQQKCFSGRYETAATLITRAIEHLESSGGNCAVLMIESQLALAEVCLHSLDRENGARAIERSLKLYRETPVISSIWLARILTWKALYSFATQDDQTSQNYLEKSLEIWSLPALGSQENATRLEFKHPERAKVSLLRAAIHLEQNQPELAEEQWLAAQSAMSPQISPRAICRQLIYLGDLCTQSGRIIAAVWFYEKARKFQNSDQEMQLEINQKFEALAKRSRP